MSNKQIRYILQDLNICGGKASLCQNCTFRKSKKSRCFDELKLEAAVVIEQMLAENKELVHTIESQARLIIGLQDELRGGAKDGE